MPIDQPPRIRGKNIMDGEINSRLIATDLQSDNYVPNMSGWLISRVTGSVEFNEGAFRGNVAIAGNLEVSGEDGILIFDGGDLTVASGGNIIVNGGQIVAGPTTLDSGGLTVGSNVVVNSTGLHVIGGLVTPVWVNDQADFSDNASLTTTHGTKNSITFNPPSWVQTLYIQLHLFAQMTDASAKNLSTRIVGDANDTGGFELGVAGSGVLSTNAGSRSMNRTFSSFPVTIEQEARVNSGTNSTNRLDLVGRAFGVRN